MGLFSFLTGSKDKREEGAPPKSPAPRPGPSAEETARLDATQNPLAASRSMPDGQSGFTPPEAWDTDALTAPAPAQTGEKPKVGPLDKDATAALQGPVVEAIKTVYDPEIPVDIYELGLIYEIIADAERQVLVKMTLTSPACPSAQQIPSEVRYKVKAIPDVKDAWVEIVWEPPWTKDMMSEAAKLSLGIF